MCQHYWVSPTVDGPFPPEEVTERCQRCKRFRRVHNRINLEGNHELLACFDKRIQKQRKEEVALNEIINSRHNHQPFHRHGQYQHLETYRVERM